MGVHPNILSSGQKSAAQNSEQAQTSEPVRIKEGRNSEPAQNS
jgi:hypothetical protein